MKAYYQVVITKEAVGAAIRHKEPRLLGTPIVKVTDAATGGDNKMIVVECSEQEHQFNLARPGVKELATGSANKLAAKYQPRRDRVELRPQSGKQEKIKIPAFDLSGFLRPRATAAKPVKRAASKAVVKKRKTTTREISAAK